jgi:hypothetical protein
LKRLHSPRVAAADRPTVPARIAHLLAIALLVLGALAASSARAQDGGRIGGASLPHVKAFGESLTYDTFSNFNCSQSGFTTDAVAHMDITGHVFLDGQSFLNGQPYDTYTEDLLTGPDTFPTVFSRVFTPPPPASSIYTFEFRSRVRQDERFVGLSVTTITCGTNGAFSAVNTFQPNLPPIPAGTPAGWAALALLLAAVAARRLRPRRA